MNPLLACIIPNLICLGPVYFYCRRKTLDLKIYFEVKEVYSCSDYG